ncbi:MAG TPA: radical SAM protein [Candidatus Methylomirabilis sp.]|nr:radical SAM protein [Candidatus Methylomirabilis sp.]
MTCPTQPPGRIPAGRAPVAPELPATLYIETTNRCDSACRTCIRTFQTLEPPRDLRLEELVRIAAQLPRLDRVVLHGIGEPLLNPALGEMIAHLKGRGALVVFNSDAIGLTERRRHGLILAGLDELRVSLDAATPETYLAIRGVPTFHRVVENVAALVELRRELGLAYPVVSLWFTALKHNVRELPDFVRLAAKVGASSVHVQRLVTYGQGLATREESLHGALSVLETEMLAQASRLAEELGLCLRASGNTTPETSLTLEASRRPWSGCQRPWSLSYITANGNVLPCCISPWTARDYAGLILGDAFTQSFADIWNGERYREFRTRFESDQPPEACRGCGRLWSL